MLGNYVLLPRISDHLEERVERDQSRTGLSIAQVVKQLRPLRSATITINGATQTFPLAIPADQRQILDALGLKTGH